jgi:hypothetical protein
LGVIGDRHFGGNLFESFGSEREVCEVAPRSGVPTELARFSVSAASGATELSEIFNLSGRLSNILSGFKKAEVL